METKPNARRTSHELRMRAHEEASRAGMPEEAGISYPIPVRTDAGLVASFFAFIAVPTPDLRNALVYRTGVRIDLDWRDGTARAVSVPDAIVSVEGGSPVGLARPPEFAGEPYGEEQARSEEAEDDLLELLDVVGPAFGEGDPAGGIRARCLAAFRRLVTPEVRPLYEELNPEFLRWLEAAAP